jgi:hypothetical protein
MIPDISRKDAKGESSGRAFTTKVTEDRKISDTQNSDLRALRTTMLQDFRGLRKFSAKLPNSKEKSTSPRSGS